jgi:predicted AAA+ superfamily ATPase
MVVRDLQSLLLQRLGSSPAVALLGSRQVGKTTLARALHFDKPTHYLDLERPSDVAKLADPELYLSQFAGELVILDEIQRVPDLFPVLRSLIDERRQSGERAAHFLLLGSASPELLQHSAETLAGRISYLELTPFKLTEVENRADSMNRLWFRGGYPDAYLAGSDEAAQLWSNDFISSYVERYLPQLGVAATPLQLRRLCTMLAHQQCCTLNLSSLSNSLAIDGKTLRRYLDLLEGLYLLRSIPAYSTNAGKRLIKSPKTYWRDSGLLHTLADLSNTDRVLGHPLCGQSWEGFCLEQIISALPKNTHYSHYRTRSGAEIDLVLEAPNGEVTAIEVKRTLSPRISRGYTESFNTLKATKGYVVIPQGERFPLTKETEAINLPDVLTQLSSSPGPVR